MDWQQIAALAIVAVAAFWLIRTQVLAPRRGGCGGCGGCGSAPAAPNRSRAGGTGRTQIVQIDLELGGSKKSGEGGRVGRH